MKSAEILIIGRVQGVWFRDFVKRNAISLKLNGWVKNTSDGNVFLEIEGEEKIINNLIEKLKIGSPLSKVKDVEIKWHPFEQKFNSFEILR
jgi:acylphosphatase